MNRAGVLKTVAITQFEIKADSFVINYEDLETNQSTESIYNKQTILSI
jgi:hypothetical protein